MSESFLKRNQKKILAIFSAGLMIAFALPSAVKNSSGRGDIPAGTVRGKTISVRDLDEGRSQWRVLNSLFIKEAGEQRIPIVRDPRYFFRGVENGDFRSAFQLATEIANRFDAHPELFYLLNREAEEMGIPVSEDEVEGVWANSIHAADSGEDYEGRAKEAIRNFLRICGAAAYASDPGRISTPARNVALAGQQEISLNLVEFKAADYLDKVPQWSDKERAEKTHQIYEKYKSQEPTTRPGNDFRFGYQIPNRVRVQAIGVPRDKVREVAGAKIGEVEARKYYLTNKTQFPETPTSQVSHKTLGVPPTEYVRAPVSPATRPASQPALHDTFVKYDYTTAVTLPPKHFDDYRDEVFKKLTDEKATDLNNKILADIGAQLATDYAAFKAAAGDALGKTATSMPASFKAPQTALGVPYDSYEYLQKLAQRTQERYGVLPVTYEDKGLRTSRELASIQGLGQASITDTNINFQALLNADPSGRLISTVFAQFQFPQYATHYVQALADPVTVDQARQLHLRVLGLYEPSPDLSTRGSGSGKGDEANYIFRVAQAEAAHAAPEAEVADRLLADARLAAAYDLAAEDAKKLAAEAQKSTLASAAKAANRKVITTGMINPRVPDIENYPLPDADANAALIAGGYQLLTKGTASNRDHPVGLVDLKPTATALAGEINSIRPPWTAETLASREAAAAAQADQQLVMAIRNGWLSYPQVAERLQFRSNETKQSKGGDNNPPADQPSQNPFVP